MSALSRIVTAGAALLLPATPLAAQAVAVPGRPHQRETLELPPQEQKRIVVLLADSNILGLLQLTQSTLADALVAKGLYLLDTPAGTTDAELSNLISTLQGQDNVVFAEADGKARTNEVDSCQGGSTGGGAGAQQCTVAFVDGTPTAGEFNGQSAVAQIRADDAQAIPHPFTPIVAVIDTGLDLSHPIFAGRLYSTGWDFVDGHASGWDTPNGVDEDGDGLVDEAYGHGTHIAGSVLAVDPDALILPVRALNADGSGSGYRVAEAIYYAVDAGADVINLSLSFQQLSAAVISALQYAEAFGVTVTTSAGNTGGTVLFPGNYDPAAVTWTLPLLGSLQLHGNRIITVTAVNSADVKASFAAHGAFVDLAAPGVSIYSAVPGNGYAWWSGTSMATGIASGAAALMIGIGGPWPLTDAAAALEAHAHDIDGSNPQYAGELGVGRIDCWASGMAVFLLP